MASSDFLIVNYLNKQRKSEKELGLKLISREILKKRRFL